MDMFEGRALPRYPARDQVSLLDRMIQRETAAISTAERHVLIQLVDNLPAANRQPDERQSLEVVARLVVHLTRVRVISTKHRRWTLVDLVLAVLAVMVVLFSAGRLLATPFGVTSSIIATVAVAVSASAAYRISAIEAARLRQRRALALSDAAERSGVRTAIGGVLSAEVPRLSRQLELAVRFEQPMLAARIGSEIEEAKSLLEEADLARGRHLAESLRLELPEAESAPKARYRREIWIGSLAWLTGLPLTREAAMDRVRWRFGRSVQRRQSYLEAALRETDPK